MILTILKLIPEFTRKKMPFSYADNQRKKVDLHCNIIIKTDLLYDNHACKSRRKESPYAGFTASLLTLPCGKKEGGKRFWHNGAAAE
jgi:hypothetical protein